jgi:hypothetical protein
MNTTGSGGDDLVVIPFLLALLEWLLLNDV